MKKLRRLFIVTALLMVLSFILPVGQVGAAPDDGFTVCSDCPPVDTLNLF